MNFYVTTIFSIFALFSISAAAEVRLQDQKYFQGDILLSSRERNGILKKKRWTNGRIPYEFYSSFSQSQMAQLQEAMWEIERHTCVYFVKRTNEPNYVRINRGEGCSANVGMQGGQQNLNLLDDSDYNCWVPRTLVHELLHVVGLDHEQCRYDRDDYITINWDKITDGRFNYAITGRNESDTYGMPYNFQSVMHYDGWRGGVIVMQPRQPGYMHVMGFSTGAHEWDFEKVRRIYDCTNSYPRIEDNMPKCEDNHTSCDSYLNICENTQWMQKACRKTCGMCWPGTPVKPSPKCEDKITYCHQMKDQCGKESGVTSTCRKTCNFCDYSMCYDTHGSCDYYKDQCATADWMKTSCKKTCGYC